MSLSKKLAVAAIVAAASISAAQADTLSDGWYAGGFGTYSIMPSVTDAGIKLTFERGLSAAHGFGAEVGYKSGPIRYEGQFLYLNNDHDTIAGVAIGGHTNLYAGFLNVLYDFDQFSSKLVPYVGAGIGYGHVRSEFPIGVVKVSANDDEFAYQLIAGANWNINKNVAIGADYRYVGTTNAGNSLGHRYQNHTVNLGLQVHFEGLNA